MMKSIFIIAFVIHFANALDYQNNEIIKITHCNTKTCSFYVYDDEHIQIRSRKYNINELYHIPNTKIKETLIKNVKGGILLIIPKNKTYENDSKDIYDYENSVDVEISDIEINDVIEKEKTAYSGYFNNRQQWISY